MAEWALVELLEAFAVLFAVTLLLAPLLIRLRIPPIIGALFVGMAAHYTPVGTHLMAPELYPTFSFTARLGVLFLLFYIGLELDLDEIGREGRSIMIAVVLNTALPFLLGFLLMRAFGYGWLLAIVVGLTRMPTAEAVIVPILDEFRLTRTRVGQFIIGCGTLDDVFEVIIVAIVSVWIGSKGADVAVGTTTEVLRLALGIIGFGVSTLVLYRWLVPAMGKLLPRQPRNLILLAMVILFSLGAFTEVTQLGMVVGAVVAGLVLRRIIPGPDEPGKQALEVIKSISYGFFGVLFFLWVGLSVDFGGMIQAPGLTLLLFGAASVGKIGGVLMMVPLKRLEFREALTIGIGLDARLTTEIVVARLLLDAGLIDVPLFTGLVGAASISAFTVPLGFSICAAKWGEGFRASSSDGSPHHDETNGGVSETTA